MISRVAAAVEVQKIVEFCFIFCQFFPLRDNLISTNLASQPSFDVSNLSQLFLAEKYFCKHSIAVGMTTNIDIGCCTTPGKQS